MSPAALSARDHMGSCVSSIYIYILKNVERAAREGDGERVESALSAVSLLCVCVYGNNTRPMSAAFLLNTCVFSVFSPSTLQA